MSDYATVGSILGNYSNYKPSTQKKLDVVFQPDLSSDYYSVVALNSDGRDGIGYDLSNNILDISGQNLESGEEENQEKSIYSIGTNSVNGFFIGSVTVLGLFILYRLLQKTK